MGLCYTNERGKFLYLAPHHGAWTILETAIENNHAGTQLLRNQSVWLQILGSDNWREVYPLAVMHDSRCLLVSKAEGGSASTEMYPFSEVLPASPLGAYFLLFAGPLLVPCKKHRYFPSVCLQLSVARTLFRWSASTGMTQIILVRGQALRLNPGYCVLNLISEPARAKRGSWATSVRQRGLCTRRCIYSTRVTSRTEQVSPVPTLGRI